MQKIKNRVNFVIIISVLLLVLIGIVNIYSASVADHTHKFFFRQIFWVLLGIGVGYPIIRINYRILMKYAVWIYGVSIFLLLMVFVLGPSIKGAHRWIVLGPVSFQPSEFAKLATVLMLASYLGEQKVERLDLKHLVIPLIIIAIPFLLIVVQPDLGTAGILLLIGGGVLLVAGISKRVFWASVVSGMISVGVLWKYFLKSYQKKRILAFLNPERDPLGAGYHIIQSKIAIGSGGWFGKGFLKGTQTQLAFLPEQHTDFAFSVFAEEWGFIGVIFVILLYMMIIFWGVEVALSARDRAGKILAAGITLHIFLHIAINLAMITGAFPVVGIPIPLFSYGGSSTIVFFLEIAMLFNIDINRYMF